MNLDKIVLEVEKLLPEYEKVNTKISSKSVGWQLHHILKVINSASKAIIKSDPKLYKWKFNKYRLLVLTTGYIPRGKVRAPKAIISENYDLEEINAELQNAKSLIARLETLDKNAYFQHPFFGDVNLKTSKRFMEVHSNHHLKIASDILK